MPECRENTDKGKTSYSKSVDTSVMCDTYIIYRRLCAEPSTQITNCQSGRKQRCQYNNGGRHGRDCWTSKGAAKHIFQTDNNVGNRANLYSVSSGYIGTSLVKQYI